MNKKKIFSFIAFFCLIVVAVFNIQLELNENSVVQVLKLNSIEALSGCEVSSQPSDNNGFCVQVYGGSGDACVTSAWTDPWVPCSGNT